MSDRPELYNPPLDKFEYEQAQLRPLVDARNAARKVADSDTGEWERPREDAAVSVRDLLLRLRNYLDINARPGNDIAPKLSSEITAALASSQQEPLVKSASAAFRASDSATTRPPATAAMGQSAGADTLSPKLQSEAVAGREEIARIIDPMAFKGWQRLYDYSEKSEGGDFAKRCADSFHKKECDEALAKADAILAALSTPGATPSGGQNE